MVHDESDAVFVGITVQFRQVEVGVWRDEVEDEVLLMAVPVFPAFVPAFDEDAIEAVGSSEVDVALHVGRVGAMPSVGFRVPIVGLAELYGGVVVGVAPL